MINLLLFTVLSATCKPMKTNVSPPWSKEDIAGFSELKMYCIGIRKPCVVEFFKTIKGSYRGACSVPELDSK